MTEVYFSLGSNVGDSRRSLSDALSRLKVHVSDLEVSSIYRTEPWGKSDQPPFLNLCARGKTKLKARELLDFTRSIENRLGRIHREKWGPREIDIDILFYGDIVQDSDGLTLPHPHLAQRAFVLIPLSEIAPDFLHPVLEKTMAELVEAVDKKGVEKIKDG